MSKHKTFAISIFKFSVPRSPRIETAVPANEHKYSITKKTKHALDDSVLAEVNFFAIKVGRICFLQYNLM